MKKLFVTLALLTCPLCTSAAPVYDVVVYGGTSAGVVAAVQTHRLGKTAIIIEASPHLGGLTRQSGGEQWSCPTSLAARIGFQPITALRGFTLRKIGGGERSCSPAARGRPIRFKRVPAPRPV